MRVYNKSKRMYQHGEYNLPAGLNIEVPEKVAKIWLATGDMVEYVDPAEAKAKEETAAAEKAELEKENEALKAELEKLKAAKAKEEKAAESKTLEELKKEADDLGIKYAPNIIAKTLQEKINAKKA